MFVLPASFTHMMGPVMHHRYVQRFDTVPRLSSDLLSAVMQTNLAYKKNDKRVEECYFNSDRMTQSLLMGLIGA